MRAIRPGIVAVTAFLVLARAVAAQNLIAQNLPLLGGSGGTGFTRSCAAGAILTGVRARTGLAIDAIGIKCRPVLANGSLGGEIDVGSLAGGTGGTATSSSCSQGSAIAGESGAVAIGTIGWLVLTCYAWKAATRTFGSQTGTISVHLPPGILNSVMAKCGHDTQPATGIHGRAGTLVDAVGLVCNEP